MTIALDVDVRGWWWVLWRAVRRGGQVEMASKSTAQRSLALVTCRRTRITEANRPARRAQHERQVEALNDPPAPLSAGASSRARMWRLRADTGHGS